MFKQYPEFCRILAGPKKRNIELFTLILIPNFLAAALEGISYALVLAAIAVLSADQASSESFLTLSILAVLCQGARSIMSGVSLYANSILALRIQEEVQTEIYQKIFRMNYSCVSQYKIGDLAEYAKTPAMIINVIMDQANKFLISLLMILATLLFMFVVDYRLAFLTLCLLIITGGLHRVIIKKIGSFSETLSDTIVDCSKQTTHTLQSIRTIHSYNRQEYASAQIHRILHKMMLSSKKVYFWNNFIPSINELLGIFFVISILLTGAWLLAEDSLPILITFIVLTHRLAIRIQMANTALGLIVTHKGSVSRLEEILSTQGVEDSIHTGIPFPGLKNGIKLLNLGLIYPTSNQPAVQNISLSIAKGATVAFVGASGAGKSSLIDLFLRLYEPTHGSIQIDGINLNHFSSGSWRDCLGVVSQDISIFNDTLEENIRFGFAEATHEDVVKAAQLAGLTEVIQALPDGYQTMVGERGFRLSGGQRQRLALARALIRNPEILLLDEATSSLDSQSEQAIQNALETLRSQRTIIIVAHRLSTIMNADHIFVLEKGCLIEQGSHDYLLNQEGKYAKFWQRQEAHENCPRS